MMSTFGKFIIRVVQTLFAHQLGDNRDMSLPHNHAKTARMWGWLWPDSRAAGHCSVSISVKPKLARSPEWPIVSGSHDPCTDDA